ncbi:MAG: hypothetical protein GX043_11660 [Desulfovibrionales bacterium]|nr:hypothetical protein [Desulfovibrionales bacterium]
MFENKNYTKVVELINNIEGKLTIEFLRIRAVSYYKIAKFQEAITDWQSVFSQGLTKAPYSDSQMAKAAIGKLTKVSSERKMMFYQFSDKPALEAGKIIKNIFAGEQHPVLIKQFSEFSQGILNNPEIAQVWIASFEKLLLIISGKKISDFSLSPPRLRIFVSGMGWSGSGAVYDFLKEYNNIEPISGEYTCLEQSRGFKDFLKLKDNKNDLKKTCIEFFFLHMLGYAPLYAAMDFKSARIARKHSQRKDYAQNCSKLVLAMSILFDETGDFRDMDSRLKLFANEIIENLMTTNMDPVKIPLFDNCIHIRSIHILKYVQDAIMFCAVRDPRSNFVALKNENKGFLKSVKKFSHDYGRYRDNHLNTKESLPSNVILVQFEEFVTSDSFRIKLAQKIGLSTSTREKFKYFKPWESFRNTQLHLDYENQDEIRYIEEHLSEYCVDFDIKPAFPKSQE